MNALKKCVHCACVSELEGHTWDRCTDIQLIFLFDDVSKLIGYCSVVRKETSVNGFTVELLPTLLNVCIAPKSQKQNLHYTVLGSLKWKVVKCSERVALIPEAKHLAAVQLSWPEVHGHTLQTAAERECHRTP